MDQRPNGTKNFRNFRHYQFRKTFIKLNSSHKNPRNYKIINLKFKKPKVEKHSILLAFTNLVLQSKLK